jgi:hypothetical protein
LNGQEKERLKFLNEELKKIWSIEEVKGRQRARERGIKEGDRNTRYFHVVINQRRRKSIIHKMEGPAGEVENTEEIVEVATNYYKDLFKYEARPKIRIYENFFSEGEKVTSVENVVLEGYFPEAEIKKVVFESYSDGAPGPDRLSFIRNFGSLLGGT